MNDLCRVAGVTRTNFYAWKTRPPSSRQLANEALLVEIRGIHATSRRTYGTPRVCGQLRRRGLRVGHNRVAKLMADNGLAGAHARSVREGPPGLGRPMPDVVDTSTTSRAPQGPPPTGQGTSSTHRRACGEVRQ